MADAEKAHCRSRPHRRTGVEVVGTNPQRAQARMRISPLKTASDLKKTGRRAGGRLTSRRGAPIFLLCLNLISSLPAATYYVESLNGSDGNDGLSPSSA